MGRGRSCRVGGEDEGRDGSAVGDWRKLLGGWVILYRCPMKMISFMVLCPLGLAQNLLFFNRAFCLFRRESWSRGSLFVHERSESGCFRSIEVD